jgi:GntR family transcriptional regulator
MVLRMQQMHSFSADLERRGFRSSRLTLAVQRVKAGTAIANLPEEFAEQELVHFRQVRYADDLAVVVFDHYFPFELCSFFLETPLDSPTFTVEGVLAAHDIVLARAKGEVRATLASEVEARYLEVAQKSPLVEIGITSFDNRERPIEYARAVVRTDRYPLALYSDWSSELLVMGESESRG